MKKNVATINTDFKGLMKHWLAFTRPIHKLSKQPQDILALLLYHYFKLKEIISDEELVWKMVFDYKTKLEIREELDIPDHTLQNNLTTLRKKNIIKGNKINKVYVPDLDINSKTYSLVYIFKIYE